MNHILSIMKGNLSMPEGKTTDCVMEGIRLLKEVYTGKAINVAMIEDDVFAVCKERDALLVCVAELENANVEQGAILEAIMGALKGEEPSDFMRSFPDVEHAWWIYRLAYPTAK